MMLNVNFIFMLILLMFSYTAFAIIIKYIYDG